MLISSIFLEYGAMSSAKYWQTERIEVSGYQIAKRVNPTQQGDKFSLLWDTKYGVMEIPVTYASYIKSSNDDSHSIRIKLLTVYNGLEDTSILQEDYPFLQHWTLHIVIWVLGILVGLASLVMLGCFGSTDRWERYFIYGWLPINILGAILGLIF